MHLPYLHCTHFCHTATTPCTSFLVSFSPGTHIFVLLRPYALPHLARQGTCTMPACLSCKIGGDMFFPSHTHFFTLGGTHTPPRMPACHFKRHLHTTARTATAHTTHCILCILLGQGQLDGLRVINTLFSGILLLGWLKHTAITRAAFGLRATPSRITLLLTRFLRTLYRALSRTARARFAGLQILMVARFCGRWFVCAGMRFAVENMI